MATGCRSVHQEVGQLVRIRELVSHPNWKGEVRSMDLKQNSYIIVKESDSRFNLLWLNNKEELVSVPFWIDTSTYQWCFQNGQAHIEDCLEKTISHIFKHFKDKECV